MPDSKEIIIEIKTNMSESIDTLAKLQKELDAVRVEQLKVAGAFKAGTKTREEADKELQVLAATQRSLVSDMKSVKKEIDNQTKAFKENEGSIQKMRAELISMRKEYESLSKSDREGDKGQKLLENISKTTNELKQLEAAQGDYRREVGHYQNAIEGLNPVLGKGIAMFRSLSNGTMSVGTAFKNGITAVKAFGRQLLSLLANPIVAAFAAIVAVVTKLTDAFKKNDEAMTALSRVFAAFKPILDIINKGFQALVNVAAKALNTIANGVNSLMSMIPGLRDYAQANDDIVVSTDKLEDAEREYAENHAEREAKIAELREKAADKENESYEDRKKALKEAQKLEEQDLKERKKNAAEKVRIAEKQALLEIGATRMTKEAWDKLTDEQKNNITKLRTELSMADKEYHTAVRKFKKEEQSITREEESERQQRAKAAAAAAKERAQKEKEALRNYEDVLIKSLANMYDREYALAKVQGERQIEDIKERLEKEKNLTEKTRRVLNEQIILMEADLQIKLSRMNEGFRRDLQTKAYELVKRQKEWLLKATDKDDLILQAKLEINTMDTESLKTTVRRELTDMIDEVNAVLDDLMDYKEGGLSEEHILMKYKTVFDLYNIDEGSTLKNLTAYYNMLSRRASNQFDILTDTLRQIEKAGEKEAERIMLEHTKGLHDREQNEIDLSRKHAEILRAIELESFTGTEVEKTRLLQEQAQERLRIANEEYQQRLADRKKYTTQELIAIYGSLDAYENAVAEANLKVVESENAVKEAVKDVANASANEKIAMIENSKAIMSSVDSILGSFNDLFTTMAESDESYADFATGMALMQILVSTAISIANAIQGATAAGAATGVAAPLTTPAFITEMIAIVTGAMVSATTTLMRAKQQKKSAPKFAEGGLVGGHYATSQAEGTRDDVAVNVSRGEYIINANAVKKYGVGFLDSINGTAANISATKFANGGYVSDATVMAGNYQFQMEMTRQMMVEALQGVHPIVSVREITAAQNRVSIAENLAQR